jgi:hypothetical protein
VIGVTGRGEKATEEAKNGRSQEREDDSTVRVAEFVFADVGEGAAAGAAVLEVGTVLVHFAEFLAHEADDFHAEDRPGANEVQELWGGDKAEGAVGFAMGTEVVRSGAEGCGESDNAARAEEPFKDFAAVVGEDRNAGEAVLNDVDAAAVGTLAHDDVVAERSDRIGERLKGLEKSRRQLERATGLRVSEVDGQWFPWRGLSELQDKCLINIVL